MGKSRVSIQPLLFPHGLDELSYSLIIPLVPFIPIDPLTVLNPNLNHKLGITHPGPKMPQDILHPLQLTISEDTSPLDLLLESIQDILIVFQQSIEMSH